MHTENSENGWYNRIDSCAHPKPRSDAEIKASREYWRAKDAHDEAVNRYDFETARRLREQHKTNF